MTASGDRFTAAAVALAIALVAPRAHAAPSDADVATARAMYRDAMVLERQGKLDEALAKIEAAYRAVKTPVLALERAKLEAQLGHPTAAYAALRDLESIPPSGHETDKSRDARREAAALATSLRERLATLRIALPADLADVEVKVDGASVDDPERVVVDPGSHAIAVTTSGRDCAAASVALGDGESRTIDLRDKVAACDAPPPAPRAASIATPAAASDPEPTPTPMPLAPIGAPKTEDGGLSTTRWVALGVGGGGALTAIIGGIVAVRAKQEYDAVAPGCLGSSCTPYAFDVREAARTHAIEATYAIAIGTVAAAAGVTLWIVDGARDKPHAARVGVAVAPNGAALRIVTP